MNNTGELSIVYEKEKKAPATKTKIVEKLSNASLPKTELDSVFDNRKAAQLRREEHT